MTQCQSKHLNLLPRSIHSINNLIMFSKFTDFSIQDRKRKYWCLMLRDEIYLHALHHCCHQFTSHCIYTVKASVRKSLQTMLTDLCVRKISSQTDERKTIHSSRDQILSLTYTSAQCGWFNVSLIQILGGPAININTA